MQTRNIARAKRQQVYLFVFAFFRCRWLSKQEISFKKDIRSIIGSYPSCPNSNRDFLNGMDIFARQAVLLCYAFLVNWDLLSFYISEQTLPKGTLSARKQRGSKKKKVFPAEIAKDSSTRIRFAFLMIHVCIDI